MKVKKIAIIGSGFGGLAAGALLAKEGFDVTVFEKNERPGGRASQLKENGFTFDLGPSWFMMPDVFDKFFAEFGKKTSDYLNLIKLTPQYSIYFEDKTKVTISGEIEKDIDTLEKLEPGFRTQFKKYLAESEFKYKLSVDKVLYKNADNIFQFFSPELVVYGNRLSPFASMHNYISKFFKNTKIQQILEYNLVFLGCSPENAPPLFSIMTHVDFNLGVWYPMGGIYEVVKAMVKIGKDYGVKYVYNTPVEKINVSGNTCDSLVVKAKKHRFDYIISNADYTFTENLLSDQTKRNYSPKYWNKKTFAPSAFLIYLGVKGSIPKLGHHTLYFGNDWRSHFKEIFDTPRWPVNPSIYINKPSATDPNVAPKGRENLFILVPVAVDLPDSPIWKESYADYIISYLEEKIGISFHKNIVYRKLFSVSDFTSRYNSYKGNALGGIAHTLFQSSIFRPSNRSKHLKNLYFVGAGTVPGIGIPPALISAHLVRDRIIHEKI